MRFRMAANDAVDDLTAALDGGARLDDRAPRSRSSLESRDARWMGEFHKSAIELVKRTALSKRSDATTFCGVAAGRSGAAFVAQRRCRRRHREAARGARDGRAARRSGLRDPRHLAC
jgi:hypothetical protein